MVMPFAAKDTKGCFDLKMFDTEQNKMIYYMLCLI